MILVALGSNLTGPWGTPHETLKRALAEFKHHNIRILKVSTLIETAPFGITNQPTFINAVATVACAMPPETLMRALHMIERRAGRKRLKRWGPRTLDLDLIAYHHLVRTPQSGSVKPLTLPHPGISQRDFVLQPIAEIAPRWKHPLSHETAALMLWKLHRLKSS
jgi:2-amino-4-hydroxy-6-hydroxymethyldihydropteridine diphosphokinase